MKQINFPDFVSYYRESKSLMLQSTSKALQEGLNHA